MNLPLRGFLRFKYNFPSYVNDIVDHFNWMRFVNRVDYFIHGSLINPGLFRFSYRGSAKTVLIGIDEDFWSTTLSKTEAKSLLKIPEDTFVLLSVSRLTRLKQIHRLLFSLQQVDTKRPWLLLLVGHGDPDYESYLHALSEPLLHAGKVRFLGYVPLDQLKLFYDAADLFVNTSLLEGGPVTSMQSSFMKTPIFTTDSGIVSLYLKRYGFGKVVGVRSYSIWSKELQSIIDGEDVATFPLELAHSLFSWNSVIRHYTSLYKYLYNSFYQ